MAHVMTNNAVLVVGMHRSGTSAVAGALEKCGVNFGSNLLPGKTGINPKGYWEDREVIELHNEFLERKGMRWDDVLFTREGENSDSKDLDEKFRSKLINILNTRFQIHPIWGVKDPRICIFIPAWLDVLRAVKTNIHIVLVVRQPYEVIASLRKRNGFSYEKCAHLWLRYSLTAEKNTRSNKRTIVDYAKMLADPRRELERVITDLGLGKELSVPENIPNFLEPSLRHNTVTAPVIHGRDSWIWNSVDTAYLQLLRTSTCGNPDVYSQIDDIENELDAFEATIPEFVVQHFRMWASDCYNSRKELKRKLDHIRSTYSWKFTAPLRRFHWAHRSKK